MLRLYPGNFRTRITVPFFLLQQFQVRFGSGQLILRGFHFARRGCAVLLQSLKRFKIALGGIPIGLSFDHLRLQGQNLFTIAAAFHCA